MSTPRLALLGALLLPPTALAGSGGALVVRATNFRNTDGQAIVEIYNAKDTWLDQGAGLVRRVVPLSGDTLELRFGTDPGDNGSTPRTANTLSAGELRITEAMVRAARPDDEAAARQTITSLEETRASRDPQRVVAALDALP